jgi:hypothetical protein
VFLKVSDQISLGQKKTYPAEIPILLVFASSLEFTPVKLFLP